MEAIRPTWRRSGERLFSILIFAVFVLEAAVLGVVIWFVIFAGTGVVGGGAPDLRGVLLGAVSTLALAVAVATIAVVSYRALSAAKEEQRAAEGALWRRRWADYLAGLLPCPAGPLSKDATAALLEAREDARGEEVPRAQRAVVTTGTERRLLDRLDAVATESRRHRGLGLRRSLHLRETLDLMDALAKARLGAAVGPLLEVARRREPSLRVLALRAAARSIAAMPADDERSVAAGTFFDVVHEAHFGRGALDEVILLLEGAAPEVIEATLRAEECPVELVASCLDGIERLGLTSLGPLVPRFLARGEPREVRAAAFRALASLPALPTGPPDQVEATAHLLRQALGEEDEVVRLQATRAAPLLPRDTAVRALWERLGDRSWWVRRAAADTLAAGLEGGLDELERAATRHPDRYGRDMARQVLREQGDPSLLFVAGGEA